MKTSSYLPARLLRLLCLAELVLALTLATSLPAETLTYTYDAAGRLITVRRASPAGTSYVYDLGGNVLDRVTAEFTDTDFDGMDDTWETFYFDNLSHDGTADTDEDGMTDLQEYLAHTEPNNPSSFLKFTNILVDSAPSVQIQWGSQLGKAYQIQYKNSLNDASWTNLGGAISGTGGTVTQTDTGVNSQPLRFYRLVVLETQATPP